MLLETSDDDFYENFGASPPADSEIEEMIARARDTGDVPLRRALKYHLALRHVAATLLERVEESDSFLNICKLIIRGEGSISADPPRLSRPWWKLW